MSRLFLPLLVIISMFFSVPSNGAVVLPFLWAAAYLSDTSNAQDSEKQEIKYCIYYVDPSETLGSPVPMVYDCDSISGLKEFILEELKALEEEVLRLGLGSYWIEYKP